MVECSHRLELKGLKHYPLAPFMAGVCGDNSADYRFWPNDRNSLRIRNNKHLVVIVSELVSKMAMWKVWSVWCAVC